MRTQDPHRPTQLLPLTRRQWSFTRHYRRIRTHPLEIRETCDYQHSYTKLPHRKNVLSYRVSV